VRILTIFVRFGTEQYAHAEEELDEIFSRQMPSITRAVLVVDNTLRTVSDEGGAGRLLIGGDNSVREFSAFDRAVQHVGSDLWRYDLLHFATSAFNTLYVDYLRRFDVTLLECAARNANCLGHVDCYNHAVEVLNFRTQHWIRTGFFFLRPTDVKILGSFVTVRDRRQFFSGDPNAPFAADAPIDSRYRQYLIDWLTGDDIGQGVRWHSRLTLTPETLPDFEQKAISILNEHLLSVRLRAIGCRVIDATWLATVLARNASAVVRWDTNWREQLANRDRDALVLSPPQ
jgi:hypothetical protein